MDNKTFFKTRKGAAIVMAVLILFSCWLGANRSLGKLYRNVENAFDVAQSAADVSIAECLNERRTYARDLLTVAGRYLAASDSTVKAVSKAVDSLEKANSISKKYEANVDLTEAAANLYDALLKKSLSSNDEMLVKKTYQNFKSLNDQMSHAAYNVLATEYNTVFKASPLSGISGRKQAELFQ